MSGFGSAWAPKAAPCGSPTCRSAGAPYESSPTAGSVFIVSTLIDRTNKNADGRPSAKAAARTLAATLQRAT